MKKKKDETATELPRSGVPIAAILIVLGIVALIGRGLWKEMRHKQVTKISCIVV